jgi:hypothetical protein
VTFELPLLAVLLLGGPSLEARAARAIERLCPCAGGDVACAAQHLRASRAIGAVAESESDAVRAIAAGCHETGYRVVVQTAGPAVTWYQLEVPVAERAALLADDAEATRRAIAATRHGWASYAGCAGGCGASRELARYEVSARWAWAAR